MVLYSYSLYIRYLERNTWTCSVNPESKAPELSIRTKDDFSALVSNGCHFNHHYVDYTSGSKFGCVGSEGVEKGYT